MKKINKSQAFFVCFVLMSALTQTAYTQMFQGKVYEGTKGVEPGGGSKPLANVTVKLYGSNNQDPLGTEINKTTTDANGWYGLRIVTGYEYYNIVEVDPSGYISDGATSVTGTVVNANRIRFVTPLGDDTLSGNKFWDKKRALKNNAPVADADGPYSGKVGKSITFDGSGSYDPDPGDYIVKYEWDFDNDGQFDDGTGKYASHTFNSTGTGLVNLRVTDTHGATGTDESVYTITESSAGEIRGTKFNDKNSNSILDPGESGISGWFIWGEKDGNGKWDSGEASSTTDSNGDYKLTGLSSGTYYIYETVQSGWTQTYPSGKYHTITVSEGQIVEDVDFGNYKREEQQDEYDYGDAPDSYKTNMVSNGARHTLGGPYFGHIQPDPELDGQPGYNAQGDDSNGVNDEDGASFPMAMVLGKSTYFNFFVKDPGKNSSIGFWIDMNMDGDFEDSGDISYYFGMTGLSMIHVTVVFKVPQTASIGNTYARFRVFQGNVKSPLAYGDGGPGEVEDYQITIKAEGDALPPGNIICGSKWNDLNGDGMWDSNESGLPNWTIWLDANQNGVKDPEIPGGDKYTQTNAKGAFLFTGLSAGKYIVGEENPPGWTQTWPGGDGTHTITVQDTIQNMCVLFGNQHVEAEEEFDWGDAPDPTYPTLAATSGANHKIVQGVYLGTSVDPELDGQPQAFAEQDDFDGNDDEDGVVFNTPLIAGQIVQITVTVSTSGYLNSWLDFNGNGDWIDTGEQIFVDESLVAGANMISFNVPANAYQGDTFVRFRFSSQKGLSFTGQAPDGEVEDYQVNISGEEGGQEGQGVLKWFQPPLHYSFEDSCFWGWDEISLIPFSIIADDWFCYDSRPVTWIRWWGSYSHWDSLVPPQYPHSPAAFHIGIWTDTPRNVDREWSHPHELIKEWMTDRELLSEMPAGCDFIPERMDKHETCFEYRYYIPKDQWFFQEGDSTVYWLSIAAIYDSIPGETLWGWKTREHYFNDDAVRIRQPVEIGIGRIFEEGEPVEHLWDMAFELGTDIYNRNFDYGDAPEIMYGTLFERNGAHHLIRPDVHLGDRIDVDPDGQPHPDAKGDDEDGNDDEDGVVFVNNLVAGDKAQITVSVSTQGFLSAWIDFNINGQWKDADDQIFDDFELSAGSHNLEFDVPNNANPGETFARFRFSTAPYMTYNGFSVNGEVEDYPVTILSLNSIQDMYTDQMPEQFVLHPNYPNPFNPSTRIKYEIPKSVHVRLIICNIRGQEIAVLEDTQKNAGRYTVMWDGRNKFGQFVTSGIYLYHIQAGEFKKAGKLLFMK